MGKHTRQFYQLRLAEHHRFLRNKIRSNTRCKYLENLEALACSPTITTHSCRGHRAWKSQKPPEQQNKDHWKHFCGWRLQDYQHTALALDFISSANGCLIT